MDTAKVIQAIQDTVQVVDQQAMSLPLEIVFVVSCLLGLIGLCLFARHISH